jgi:hypothetical protein
MQSWEQFQWTVLPLAKRAPEVRCYAYEASVSLLQGIRCAATSYLTASVPKVMVDCSDCPNVPIHIAQHTSCSLDRTTK